MDAFADRGIRARQKERYRSFKNRRQGFNARLGNIVNTLRRGHIIDK